MNTFEDIPDDILQCIINFLPIEDQIYCRQVNKSVLGNIKQIKILIWYFDNKLNLPKKIYMCENNSFVMCNHFKCGNFIPCRHELKFCVNNACCNNIRKVLHGPLRRKKVVGSIYFYYPKYFPSSQNIHNEDNDNDNDNDNAVYDNVYFDMYDQNIMNKIYACQEGPHIKRYIPYCIDCMEKYVNYGHRTDGLHVPFGGPDGLIFNYT